MDGFQRRTIQMCLKESLDRVEDGGPSLRMIDSLAQRGPALHSVSEPGDELLHLAGSAVHFLVDQHGEIAADHLVAIAVGG